MTGTRWNRRSRFQHRRAARLAAIAAPVPELDPQGLRSSAYGFFVWPPRALQPLDDFVDRKFAHSLRFVLPRITAPAARSRSTTNASASAIDPSSASDPAVVIMRSAVSMLSLMRTGMPCSGPRGPFALRSASSASAIVRASGLISMTGAQRRTTIDRSDRFASRYEIDELPRGITAVAHPLLQLLDRRLVEWKRRRRRLGAKSRRRYTKRPRRRGEWRQHDDCAEDHSRAGLLVMAGEPSTSPPHPRGAADASTQRGDRRFRATSARQAWRRRQARRRRRARQGHGRTTRRVRPSGAG